MNTIPVSVEVLAGILGKPAGSLSDALKADGEWKAQSEIDSHVKATFNEKLKSIRKEGHDEGHGRGKRESLSEKEKELREKYGLKSQTLDELFEEVKAGQGPGSGNLDEESIKASPIFQDAVKKLQDKIREKDNEFKTFQETVRSRELHASLKELATKVVTSKENKFVLPEDPTIQETQIELYLELLKKRAWKKAEDGTLVPLSDKGDDQLKDDSFNPISGTEYARQIAQRMFIQAKGEQREAPGVNTKPPANGTGSNGANGQSYNFPAFKTRAEAMERIRATKDPAELDALQTHINSLKEAGTLN